MVVFETICSETYSVDIVVVDFEINSENDGRFKNIRF